MSTNVDIASRSSRHIRTPFATMSNAGTERNTHERNCHGSSRPTSLKTNINCNLSSWVSASLDHTSLNPLLTMRTLSCCNVEWSCYVFRNISIVTIIALRFHQVLPRLPLPAGHSDSPFDCHTDHANVNNIPNSMPLEQR